ncbi:MAG TPA: hypothetical protein PKM88_02310 [bacterium]|nr:hypothetical protein [bacterium]
MAAERRARWMMVISGLLLMMAIGLVAKADLPLAAAAQAIPQTGISPANLEQFNQEHQIELYTLYYDFDHDGDIDIAYAMEGPIRIVENQSVPTAVPLPVIR